jgi:NTP pyrophosphatase (non-canonical NTP hydrolase)
MSTPPRLDVADVQRALREFAAARDWEQFHTPKNLVMALAGEVGELCDLFQWLDADQSRRVMDDPQRAAAVGEEIADVLNYVLRLADVLGVDLQAAVGAKIVANAAKYPADLVRGRADKYTGYRQE